MKSKEELTAFKNVVEAINKKLPELNEDELKRVTGGSEPEGFYVDVGDWVQAPPCVSM